MATPDQPLVATSLASFTDDAPLAPTLVARHTDAATYREDGPVPYDVRENVLIRLSSTSQILADSVAPRQTAPAPLVIIVHGNHSRKEAHRRQAEMLASYGLHGLAVQVPNTNHWLHNGRLLARLVRYLHDHPVIHGSPIDPDEIVLVGHSFGGSAVALAAAAGAPVKGLVLLDPAIVNTSRLKQALPRVSCPTFLLASDPTVFRARRQALFYKLIQGPMARLSVVGATHDDAQNPSMFSLTTYGIDPFTSPNKQAVFTAALTAAAISLVTTGRLDYAWQAVSGFSADGLLENLSRRNALPVPRPKRAAAH